MTSQRGAAELHVRRAVSPQGRPWAQAARGLADPCVARPSGELTLEASLGALGTHSEETSPAQNEGTEGLVNQTDWKKEYHPQLFF